MEGYSRVDLGPLTTTFTPAPSCSEDLALEARINTLDDGNLGSTVVGAYWGSTIRCLRLPGGASGGGTLTTETQVAVDGCYPPPFITLEQSDLRSTIGSKTSAVGFFSPGYVCPSGFTTACGVASGNTSAASQVSKLLPMLSSSETVAVCCPRYV